MIQSRTTELLRAAMARGLSLSVALVAALSLHAQQIEHHQSSPEPGKGGQGEMDTASCIKQAAQMNMAVVQFGRLAVQRAQNAELKRFGEQIEKDHKKAQERLETIAKKHDVTLPTSLDPKCQEELTKLQGLSGREFDREFAKGAVEGHAMGIAMLQKAVEQTRNKDTDLAQYTQDMLAQLKRHQERGREVAKAVGLDQETIASIERQARQSAEAVGTPGASSLTERGSSSSQEHQEKGDTETQDPSPQP
jgi:putative membrane protein